MLKNLIITNIVLIESADIPFEHGLNVLSGETGSGKSAIMEALRQISGARADNNIIRHGADKGIIEAVFDINYLPQVQHLLQEGGIDHEPGDELIIRREISSAGRSRAFINNQLAHLGLLKQIGNFLLDIVGQHANQRLFNLEQHREIIDLFGDVSALRDQFQKSWAEEGRLRRELKEMIDKEAQRLREIEVYRMEIQELEEAQIHDGEEETLFEEYSRLSHAEELSQHSHAIQQALSGDKQPLIPQLHHLKKTFDLLIQLDPSLEECAKSFHSASIELEEISHLLRNYQSSIEFNPQRCQEVNDRLACIHRIKRKYGPTLEDVQHYHQQTAEKLHQHEHADLQIEELQARIKEYEICNDALANKLTKKREISGRQLEKEMSKHLHTLNMPKATFYVEITPQNRTRSGDNRIEFFFIPNIGGKKMPIRECASGGELSRLMLSLQTLLAGKEQTPTLIFDEIDANIGGETAKVVGEKLQQISELHQVLCITHFPQVAKYAHHHLQISKREQEGHNVTTIESLDKQSRKKELARMIGN